MDGRHVQADCLQVDLKPASDVLAGAVARAASQGTIHPLDTLKVRMQHSSTTNTLSKFGRLVPPAGDPQDVVASPACQPRGSVPSTVLLRASAMPGCMQRRTVRATGAAESCGLALC